MIVFTFVFPLRPLLKQQKNKDNKGMNWLKKEYFYFLNIKIFFCVPDTD